MMHIRSPHSFCQKSKFKNKKNNFILGGFNMAQNKNLELKEQDILIKCKSSNDKEEKKYCIKDHQEKETEQTLSKDQEPVIKRNGKLVTFSINAPHAKKVKLGGDFNNWNYENTSLMKDDKADLWKKEIFIEPGQYEYKFMVDENWLIDPNNINKAWNIYGSENSVIEIK